MKKAIDDDPLRIVKLADLNPYKNNSRRHSDKQIEKVAESIREFGFLSPVVIDENGMIIAGHGRVMAAKRLGLEEVPAIMARDLTEEQKKAFVIADNKLGDESSWDEEALAKELSALLSTGFDLSKTGFDDDEISKIIDIPEVLTEKKEELRDIKWTRILISIPNGEAINLLDEALKNVISSGGQVDYGGN